MIGLASATLRPSNSNEVNDSERCASLNSLPLKLGEPRMTAFLVAEDMKGAKYDLWKMNADHGRREEDGGARFHNRPAHHPESPEFISLPDAPWKGLM
jgi:hypothetical protein